MKFAKLFTLSIVIFMGFKAEASPFKIAQKNNIDFNNVDKNVEGWKYFLNSQEVTFLPEIELNGGTKFLPVEIVRSLGANLIMDTANKTAYITNNDETFVVKENSKQIYLNNKSYLISDEVRWINNTLYVPSGFLIKLGILVSENKYKNELNVIKGFNLINDISSNFDNLESKIIFNLNTLPVYDTEEGNDYYKITLYGTSSNSLEKLKKQLSAFTTDFKKIDIETSKPGITNITFYPKGNLELVNTYYLDKPARLVVQFPKLYKNEVREKVTSSLYKSKLAEGTYQGPNKINLIEVNTKKDLLLKPVIAKDSNGFTLKEVSKVAKDFNAIAGINGGYFSGKTKFPLGLVYLNNELLGAPIYNRSALLFNKDGSFEIKNIDLNIFLKVTDAAGTSKQIKINAFNQPPVKNQLVLFTYNYGKNNLNKPVKTTNPTVKPVNENDSDSSGDEIKEQPVVDEYSAYMVSNKGEKLTKLTSLDQDIPQGNFVIYASGKGRDDLDKAIENMSAYEINFNYSEPLDKVINALGGGPTLVKDGSINITAQAEKFKPDITEGKAPRTAVGILQNNHIMIFTVDGRQDNSKGMTLEEVAYFLKTHDAKDAINFDGGGSTTLYLNGDILSVSSDPKERKVSNGLYLFQKK